MYYFYNEGFILLRSTSTRWRASLSPPITECRLPRSASRAWPGTAPFPDSPGRWGWPTWRPLPPDPGSEGVRPPTAPGSCSPWVTGSPTHHKCRQVFLCFFTRWISFFIATDQSHSIHILLRSSVVDWYWSLQLKNTAAGLLVSTYIKNMCFRAISTVKFVLMSLTQKFRGQRTFMMIFNVEIRR